MVEWVKYFCMMEKNNTDMQVTWRCKHIGTSVLTTLVRRHNSFYLNYVLAGFFCPDDGSGCRSQSGVGSCEWWSSNLSREFFYSSILEDGVGTGMGNWVHLIWCWDQSSLCYHNHYHHRNRNRKGKGNSSHLQRIGTQGTKRVFSALREGFWDCNG